VDKVALSSWLWLPKYKKKGKTFFKKYFFQTRLRSEVRSELFGRFEILSNSEQSESTLLFGTLV
jgi:hypothetical protein